MGLLTDEGTKAPPPLLHGRGEGEIPLPKICHTFPAMIKPGTVISYLKKIQKIYESRGTPLSSADINIFHWKSANFAVSKNADIDCILIHSF